MKVKLTMIAVVLLALTACKKDYECECTTVYYDGTGTYVGSEKQNHLVSSQTQCDTYKKDTAQEVTNCILDKDND